MKKLMLFLICAVEVILLLQLISAFEFDNVKNYNSEDRSVTIKNSILGIPLDEVAKVTPLTPHINYVIPGKDRLVAKFEIDSKVLYSEKVWDDMNFFDLKRNDIEINRNYKLKYLDEVKKTTKIVEVCNKDLINDKIVNCKNQEIVSEEELWKDLDINSDLQVGKITIGVFADVNQGDYVEFIPTWFGVYLNEYSVWTDALSVNLRNYYKFDENIGNTTLDNIASNNITNGTTTQGLIWNATGLIGAKIQPNGTVGAYGRSINNIDYLSPATKNLTINFWGNRISDGRNQVFLSFGAVGSRIQIGTDLGSGKWDVEVNDEACSILVGSLDEVFNMHTIVFNKTDIIWYVNGVSIGYGNCAATAASGKLFIGTDLSNLDTRRLNGSIDEMGIWNQTLSQSQITDLYNGGAGISYNAHSPPIVTLESPIDSFSSSSPQITFNCSSIVNYDRIISNISLYENSTGVWIRNLTNTSINPAMNSSLFIVNFSDGTYEWNCLAFDNESDGSYAPANRTFSILTLAPIITITHPIIRYDFNRVGGNEIINWTVDSSNLDSCWFNYMGINTTVVCSNNGTIITLNDTFNNFNITFYANDSVGNEASEYTNWSYNLFERNQIYNASTSEFAQETFSINISYNGTYTPSAYLVYNGTEYLGSSIGSSSNRIFTRSITIPSTNDGSFDFYWKLGLTNSTGTFYFNSTTHSQTIGLIQLGLCNASLTTVFLNFTIWEEATFTSLNQNLELTLNYWLDGSDGTNYKTFSYQNFSADKHEYDFCLSPSYSSFRTSGDVSYGNSTLYLKRDYIFQNALLNNVTQHIPLYLQLITSSDIVQYTVLDESNVPVKNAIVSLLRWDVGTNNFYTIGMFSTDDNGQGAIDLRLYDAWYKEVVSYNVRVYLITEKSKISSTTKTLTIILSQQNIYSLFNNVSYSLTYNNDTSNILFEYSDPSGVTATGCLRVLNMKGNSTTQVYNSCVYSPSGTLSYMLTENGTFVAQGILILNNSYGDVEKIVDSIVIQRGISAWVIAINGHGYVAGILLIGTLALVGVAAGSIILGLFLVVIGAYMANFFGLINFTTTVIYSLIGIALVIAITLRRRGG